MPTIGNPTVEANNDSGAGSSGWSPEAVTLASLRYVAAAGDTVTAVYYYSQDNSGGGGSTVDVAVYDWNGTVPVNRVGIASITIGATLQWWSTSVSWALTAGVEYVCAVDYNTSGQPATQYAFIGGTQMSTGNGTSMGATWSQFTTSGFRNSFYADVTAGAGGGFVRPSIIVPRGAVNRAASW